MKTRLLCILFLLLPPAFVRADLNLRGRYDFTRKARTATYVVAASNAPAHVKAQSDFVCDGVADNVEIQAAIDKIDSEGGEIYLHGVFVIDDTIDVVDKPITFRGIGKNWYWAGYPGDNYVGTTIRPSDTMADQDKTLFKYRGNMYFGGLYEIGFCGVPTIQNYRGVPAILIDSRGDFIISNCGFFYLPYDFVIKLNCHGSWIYNCDIEDCVKANGALYVSSHRNWVVNCYFRGNKEDLYSASTEQRIINCRFYDTQQNQIYLSSSEAVIANGSFETWNQQSSNFAAIEFQGEGARRIIIANNYFLFPNTNGAPAIWDNDLVISDVVIANNLFYGRESGQRAITVPNAVAPISIKGNIGDDETVTGTVTLQRFGSSYLDSSGGAVTATLPDGLMPGDIKVIRMSDATNSSTVTVTHHKTSDPEVGTFDATTDYWILAWSGDEWVTIDATCSF